MSQQARGNNEGDGATISGDVTQGYRLSGILRAPAVSQLVADLPVAKGAHQLDLAALEAVDSAGLALLVEWQRQLQAAGGELAIANAPSGLIRLARISGVDTLLGLMAQDDGDD